MRLEFHCHTAYSEDCLTSPQKLVETCRRRGIERVVVTDHNSITGAVLAQTLDPQRVIVGEEIMTQKGELLAAFVREPVPANLPPLEAIQALRDQGAFISVSHPFDELRKGHWALHDLEEIAPLVDAIEIFNARCIRAEFNQQAEAFARQHSLAGTAGSDAHHPFELGRACLLIPPFLDADGLRQVIRESRVDARLSSPWVHFFSRYAKWRKRRSGHLIDK